MKSPSRSRLLASTFSTVLVGIALGAGWCQYCNTAFLMCDTPGGWLSTKWCGSYDHDNPQACSSYTRTCWECGDPQRPKYCQASGTPPLYGYVCVTGVDCY
jgi:hypothetical protein